LTAIKKDECELIRSSRDEREQPQLPLIALLSHITTTKPSAVLDKYLKQKLYPLSSLNVEPTDRGLAFA